MILRVLLFSFVNNSGMGLFLTCQNLGCNNGLEFAGIKAIFTLEISFFHFILHLLQLLVLLLVLVSILILYIIYNL